VTDSDAYHRGADLAREALYEAIGKPIPAKVLRALAAERRYGPYEPGGEAWEASKARRNGEEYQGGPVCWSECVGICRVCRHTETETEPKEHR